MFPEVIYHFSIGPFFGLAANAVMAVLCLVALTLFRHYRPLRSLFLFYLFLAFCFLGWVIYGLQKSPQSILIGYRMDYTALALLPACWVWFITALFHERLGWFPWTLTGISISLAALALFGRGPTFFGLPLEPDPIAANILRPQSLLLRPVIQYFCLMVCLFYLLLIIRRLWRLKEQRQVYLVFVGLGLLFWLLGGFHDAIRSMGITIITHEQVLWFASLWLSIFLTLAVAFHFRSLEQMTREELERLNRAKSKALDHLSHELRTPLAVIQGKIRLLKRKLQMKTPLTEEEVSFGSVEKQLNRLFDIQQETEKIIRSYRALERSYPTDNQEGSIPLFPFAASIVEKVKEQAAHREIHFYLEGEKDLYALTDPTILNDILEGLLKNAVENSPDEGMIKIILEPKHPRLILKVQDFGVGITEENQRYLFDGLFHTQETDLYSSKKPYDFNAGGKGLDLLRMKVYERHFGFDLWVESRRCLYLPSDRDLCPGRISACPHCKEPKDCLSSGGSTFFVSFPIAENKDVAKMNTEHPT